MLGWVSLQPAKFWLKLIPHTLLILRRELWKDSVVSPLRTGPRSLGSPCCGACSGMFLRQMLHQKISALISGRSLFWLNVQRHLKRGFKGLSFFFLKKQTLMSVWIISDRYFAATCFVFLNWRMPVWGWSTCVFLLGDKPSFENKFQCEHPLRKGLFIWQSSLWSHMRNYVKREAPDRAEKKKIKIL